MSAQELLQKARSQLGQSFIDPLRDRQRFKLLAGTFIGVFFAALQSMVLNYGIVSEGLHAATLYHVARLLFLGLVGVPMTFWLLSLPSGRWGLVIMQAVGAGLFLFGIEHTIHNVAGFVLLASPFWAVFHKTYGIMQSEKNHSRETALFVYTQTLAGATGIFCGGYFLQTGAYTLAMALSGSGLIIATFLAAGIIPKSTVIAAIRKFMDRFLSRENLFKKSMSLIDRRRPTSQLTFLCGMVTSLLEIGLPTWMGLIGVPPLSAGFKLGLRPVLGLILTPVVGSMVEKSSVRVGQLGAAFMVIGWLMLVGVLEYPFLMMPALALLAVATNMVAPAELGWWLKKRSSAGIVARELLLTSGRVPALSVMVPSLFLFASSFPFIGLAGSAIFFVSARYINRKISFRNALGWRASNRSQSQR